MIPSQHLSDINVFDVEHSEFEFRRVAEHLNHRKLVILYARTDRERAPEGGFEWLGHDERQRYHDYICESDAIQFLKARTLVRNILVHYLNVAPFDIRLTSVQHIKPIAACDNPYRPIPHFNISHSGDWISVALHADLPLGLDIECSDVPELDRLCKSEELFNEMERSFLDACPNSDLKFDLFYRYWRCKEAVMKATGKGFALAPCTIGLTSDDGSIKTTIIAEGKAWQLHQIDTCANLKLAVAIQQSRE